MLGGQGGGGASCGHDDINLERNQFGRKSREPLELPLGISVVDHDIATLDVAEGPQSLEEGLSQVRVGARVERQEAYSRGFPSRLRLDGEGHGEETEGASDEHPSLHYSVPPTWPRCLGGTGRAARSTVHQWGRDGGLRIRVPAPGGRWTVRAGHSRCEPGLPSAPEAAGGGNLSAGTGLLDWLSVSVVSFPTSTVTLSFQIGVSSMTATIR